MTFEQSIKTCFKKYAVFSGRASRSEYWWWVLFIILAGSVVEIFDAVIFLDEWGPVSTLFWLVILLPDICVTFRRLHDFDRTGWWVLYWPLIMVAVVLLFALYEVTTDNSGGFRFFLGIIICIIWQIVWFATKGTQGDNRFGSDPLAPQIQEVDWQDSSTRDS